MVEMINNINKKFTFSIRLLITVTNKRTQPDKDIRRQLGTTNGVVDSASTMILLNCCCQNYAWGKLGSNSEVAMLCSSSDRELKIDDAQPYAELWIGTHPKGPSKIKDSGELLAAYLANNTSVVGDKLCQVLTKNQPNYKHDGLQLPFLFKVLSVNQALSIQVHPTKEQAKVLHSADPANYPDDNHKPEMAIALTPFELLCGFRPPAEIIQAFKETPELFELISSGPYYKLQAVVEQNVDPNSEPAKAALKECFYSLMNQPNALIQKSLSTVAERFALQLNQPNISPAVSVRNELIIRLNFNYPGDVGCFAPFFLNHFVLQPGEATFLGPNEPHAYLYGDCMECMACSDNTIRAGLTPKFKDVSRLVDMLTYRMVDAAGNKFTPTPADKCLTIYQPPVAEFTVHKINVTAGRQYNFTIIPTCSLLIVINGSSTVVETQEALSRGFVALLPANYALNVSVTSSFLAFRAFCDEKSAANV